VALILTLLYLSDLEQFNYLVIKDCELINSATIITGDMTLSFELERKNISFIDIWSFLHSKELERNRGIAYRIYESSLSRNGSFEINTGYDFSNIMQQDLFFAVEAMLNASVVYSKIFNRHKIKEIYGYFIKPQALIRTGPALNFKIANSISEGILFYFANEKKIKIKRLGYKKPKILTSIINSLKNYSF